MEEEQGPAPPKTYGACSNRSCTAGCSCFIPPGIPGYIPQFNKPALLAWVSLACVVCQCFGAQHLHPLSEEVCPHLAVSLDQYLTAHSGASPECNCIHSFLSYGSFRNSINPEHIPNAVLHLHPHCVVCFCSPGFWWLQGSGKGQRGEGQGRPELYPGVTVQSCGEGELTANVTVPPDRLLALQAYQTASQFGEKAGVKRKYTPASQAKTKKSKNVMLFRLAFIPETSQVYAGTRRKPNSQGYVQFSICTTTLGISSHIYDRISDLNSAGAVKNLELQPDASHNDIVQDVHALFDSLVPPMSSVGFCLLEVTKHNVHGKPATLRPLFNGDDTMMTIDSLLK